jgi:hypothetical protein
MLMENDAEDWLFPNKEKEKEVSSVRELQVAQLYLCFEIDENAKKLLAMWTALVRNCRISENAPVQEYAARNAVREFVEGIYRQIERAKNRGSLPQ